MVNRKKVGIINIVVNIIQNTQETILELSKAAKESIKSSGVLILTILLKYALSYVSYN